jgi:glycogen(starch) synthase
MANMSDDALSRAPHRPAATPPTPGAPSSAARPSPVVKPLVLGMGWFPDQESGLNRYFRNLLDALGGPLAIVVGPAGDAPSNVRVVERHESPAWRRMLDVTRATLAHASRADVIDAHFAMYAFLPVLLGLKGKPFVAHFHGLWGTESIAGMRTTRPKALVRWAMERAVYRSATTVVVLSNAFKELLVRRYGVQPEAVRVVRPGVDLDRFSPGDRHGARQQLGLPPDRPIVVTARRLVRRMGIDVLLESWAQVVSAGQGQARPVLLVVGDGQYRSALEAQTRRLGLEQDVRFLGKVSDRDLLAAYRAADVAVAPSLSLEGFGLVTLEALACGTPVIGTAVGGLQEALEGLDGTMVVPPGDPRALADRLLGVLHGHEPAPSRARCRKYAEEFTWERTAREIREIYRTAVFPAA